MRRAKHIRVLMSRTEKTTLEMIADREGLSQAAIMRRLLRAEGRRQGLWPGQTPEPLRVVLLNGQ